MSKPFIFKERVIVSKAADWPSDVPKNRNGRIWEHDNGEDALVGIRFDKSVEGHDLGVGGPRCPFGYGRYIGRTHIRRLHAKKA